jgi:hypothetical protein
MSAEKGVRPERFEFVNGASRKMSRARRLARACVTRESSQGVARGNTSRIGRRKRPLGHGRCPLPGDLNGGFGLRAQPVDATPSIRADKGLKPMAFLRGGLATIQD